LQSALSPVCLRPVSSARRALTFGIKKNFSFCSLFCFVVFFCSSSFFLFSWQVPPNVMLVVRGVGGGVGGPVGGQQEVVCEAGLAGFFPFLYGFFPLPSLWFFYSVFSLNLSQNAFSTLVYLLFSYGRDPVVGFFPPPPLQSLPLYPVLFRRVTY